MKKREENFDYLNVYNKCYSFWENRKQAKERAKFGFCRRDIWGIDTWFLHIMPRMIEKLRDTHLGFPTFFTEEYYELNKENISLSKNDFCNHVYYNDYENLYEKLDEWCNNRWIEVLSEMIFLFDECDDEKCTMKNEYYEEYSKMSREFDKKYGFSGEKLRTQEEIESDKKTGNLTNHSMRELPENKNILDKYFKRQDEIDKYKTKCKKEALNMFVKYFDDLWD